MSIAIFGFRALWSPYYFSILVILSIGYFLFIKKFGPYITGNRELTKRQVIYFLSAILLLYIVKGSPIDLMSHIMFSVHMVQMAILYLLIPPLFIIAIPVWLWRWILKGKRIQWFYSFFQQPLVALLNFNIFFSFYHIPFVFDHVNTNMWLHTGYTLLLFTFAFFMWFPLVHQIPEKESLSGIQKVAYIFGSGILLTPACALIIFANQPLYLSFYNPKSWSDAISLCVSGSTLSGLSGPEMFSGLSAIEDQQLGGVLMKIIQEIILGYMLGVIFFTWYRKENNGKQEVDPIPVEWKR